MAGAGVQVFSKWKNEKRDVLRKQEEEAIAERKRKGILSGREIFAQVCSLPCSMLLMSFAFPVAYSACVACLCCLLDCEASAPALVCLLSDLDIDGRCNALGSCSPEEGESGG